MDEWLRLGARLGVKYRHTKPDHFEREHDLCVGYDGVYLTNAELLALAQASGVYRQVPEVQTLVDYVTRQEWEGDRNEAFCLDCGRTFNEGHAEGCRWVAALAPFKEPTDA